MIQPTPLKLLAFFLLYEPSVTHISKFCLIPFERIANHHSDWPIVVGDGLGGIVVSSFVSWSLSIPSHI
jgi:hypothetical protein